jgi:hypothetical protein
MGNSGNSTGTHLHFQVEKQGAPLAPELARDGTVRWSMANPVSPRLYLGDIGTNLTPEQEQIYCNTNSFGEGQLTEPLPYISEDEAKTLIARFVRDQLHDPTELEYNNDNLGQRYKTKGSFGDKRDDINFLKSELDIYRHKCDFNYILNLGKIKEKRGEDGYDGAIVVNGYEQKAYLVKNAIFEKYYKEDMGCGVIGVPQNWESKANVNNGSVAIKDQAWWQPFRKGREKNTQNGIYAYNQKNGNWPWSGTTFRTFFVVNNVANQYHSQGGSGSNYGFPTGDTYGDGYTQYCKQWFEGGEMDLCGIGIEEPFIVSVYGADKKLSSKAFDLKIHHSPNLQLHQNGYFKYNNQNDSYRRNVWIVTHGMNDSRNGGLNNVADALKSVHPDDIILTFDWSSGAAETGLIGVDPHGTSKWIDEAGLQVVKKLKKWGFEDPSKLRLVGHSMGTVMSTQISENFGNNVELLIALDPPRTDTVLGIPENTFRVRYNKDGNPTKIFDGFAGHFKHSKSLVGKSSFCGNYTLNQTADQSYLVHFVDPQEYEKIICPVHGAVVQAYANLIKSEDRYFSDQTINFKYPYISNEANNVFAKYNFYDAGWRNTKDNVNGVIVTSGSDVNPKIEHITYRVDRVANNQGYRENMVVGTNRSDTYRLVGIDWNINRPFTISNYGDNQNKDKIQIYENQTVDNSLSYKYYYGFNKDENGLTRIFVRSCTIKNGTEVCANPSHLYTLSGSSANEPFTNSLFFNPNEGFVSKI